MKRTWQLINICSLVFALVMNVLMGAQILDIPGINEISDAYATLLTPAGYAFSIWSLIYVLLVVFVVYQARDLFKPSAKNDLPEKVGPWFFISSVCNGLWTLIFVKEFIGASVLVLLLLTASLYVLVAKLRIAVYDARPVVIACVWWPILIYTGWVTVAGIVNIASWLDSLGYAVSPLAASLTLITVSALLVVLLIKRNVRELVLASAWGIAAIGAQQAQVASGNTLVATIAFVVSGMLLISACIHAYIHRATSIAMRLKKP